MPSLTVKIECSNPVGPTGELTVLTVEGALEDVYAGTRFEVTERRGMVEELRAISVHCNSDGVSVILDMDGEINTVPLDYSSVECLRRWFGSGATAKKESQIVPQIDEATRNLVAQLKYVLSELGVHADKLTPEGIGALMRAFKN